MKEEYRLSRENWEQLDALIGKHGFGGYYDLVECLKGVLSKLEPEKNHDEIKDLPTVVHALMNFQ